MKRINKFTVGIIILIITSIFAVPFIFWNFTFGFYAAWFLLFVFAGGWYYFLKKRKLKVIPITLLIGFIGYMAFLPLTTGTLNQKQREYYQKIKSGRELNLLEMWNLYGLHITIIFAGAPIAPQASYEMIFMHFPDKDKKRTHYSDFFLESKKLQQAMAKSDKGHLAWTLKDYYLTNPEHKVALALNPLDYEVRRYDDRIEYYMTVPLHWHYGVDVMLSWPVRFEVNESLMRYLEERKWLHMHWATWRHTEWL
jgi:hypothetical protein